MPMSVFVEESGSTAVIIAVLIAAVMTCFFGTSLFWTGLLCPLLPVLLLCRSATPFLSF